MSADDRRRELQQRIHQLQQSLASIEASQQEPPAEATLQTVATQISNAEKRILQRFNSSERYVMQQMDDQTLASVMITGLMIASGLYVMYFLIENLFRVRRCRCPEVSSSDIEVVVAASKIQYAKYCDEQKRAAAQPPHPPQPAVPASGSS